MKFYKNDTDQQAFRASITKCARDCHCQVEDEPKWFDCECRHDTCLAPKDDLPGFAKRARDYYRYALRLESDNEFDIIASPHEFEHPDDDKGNVRALIAEFHVRNREV